MPRSLYSTMYFGPADSAGFYNAAAWGAAPIANVPPLLWFLAVASSSCARVPLHPSAAHSATEREHHHGTQGHGCRESRPPSAIVTAPTTPYTIAASTRL